MRDKWVSLQAGVDPREWARLLRRAHEAAVTRGHPSSIVREVVADSWERCATSGLEPGKTQAPLTMDPDDVSERWAAHPLSRSTDLLRSVLADLLHDARHIVVVSDADGTLLWSEGHPDVLRASESIRFVPGYSWTESDSGTNAVGTALAADHAVQIFSAEHYRSEVHAFQCSGAPVHDPETGEILGVIDVTGNYRTAHPHSLALVQTAARMVEQHLRAEHLERDARILELYAEHTGRHGGHAAAATPSGRVLAATTAAWKTARVDLSGDHGAITLADGTAAIAQPLGEGFLFVPARGGRPARRRLTLTAGRRATLTTPEGTHRLTERHSQIVTILADHPAGLTTSELAELVFGEDGHDGSLRTELHRLRRVLDTSLATRPYRLEHVDVEHCAVV